MKINCTLFLCLTVVQDSIGSGSQPQPAAVTTTRLRSRSPTLRETFPCVLGFKFEDLALIRLRPHDSPHRVFELRRYSFTSCGSIGLRINHRSLKPMPAGERIGLSTSNGDVYAVLHRSSNRHTVLRAICIRDSREIKRAKINMNTGAARVLTAEEIAECPVPTQEQVAKSYDISILSPHPESLPDVNTDLGTHQCGPSSSTPLPAVSSQSPAGVTVRARSRSPTLRETFPNVFGYEFEDLKFIRLSPHDYPHRIFELKKYVFPPGEPIGLRTKNYVLNPMPTGPRIVLSTPNGDVCAILLKSPGRYAVIRPIFTSTFMNLERVKINMNNGAVQELSPTEIAECPVIYRESITKIYRVFRV